MSDNWGFDTKQIHAGSAPDPTTGARATPIYQTTSFQFNSSKHAADLFALADVGNIYSRIMNPTQAVFEARVNALEGGCTTAIGIPGSLAMASGQAAETLTFITLAEGGGHIVSSSHLYGGTYNLLHYSLPKLGIETTFIDDIDDLDAWRAAVRPNTRLFFGESLSNPANSFLDLEGVSNVAHEAGVPLVIDNTVASPWLLRPLEWGADIVINSATKFIGGHGTSIGGIITDGGTFDFGNADRFPAFNEPDPSYNGLPFWPALGHGAFILKARVQGLRDYGAATTPFNSFLFIQGLETLSLRVERHNRNAEKVADFLVGRAEVESVAFAGLPTSKWHARAKQLTAGKGFGSVLAFNIKGGREAGAKFVEGLSLHSHVANIGDVRSLAIHPASTTHSQLSEAEQAATGVYPGLVRLSVGIESVEDIIADLELGFAAANS
jgi:O-acetylhomoserine (thiol)-lyase